jgi:hypothetical protein
MRKKCLSNILVTIVLVLLIFQFSGCKEDTKVNDISENKEVLKETNDSVEVSKVGESTKETKVIDEKADNNAEWNDFASISNFLDLIDQTTNKLDDATGEIDSFAVIGDMILMYQIGVMINDATLEQALNESKDTYISEVNEAPNGSGTYSSSITYDGDSYFFGYDFYYNDGSSYNIKLSYVPSKKTVSAERSHTDGSITQANYVATDKSLFVSYGDSRKDISQTNQMLICQVGNNVYYATKTVEEYNSEPLPIDIFGVSPTDWDSFATNFDFQRSLKVEDGQVDYIEK